MLIRPARQGDEQALTELLLRSKAHWQYTPEQMEAWRPELTITSETIAREIVFVGETEEGIAGFGSLTPGPTRWVLEHLWVEPRWIGRGIGKGLLTFACQLAADQGAIEISIDAEPNAEAFYQAFGATRVGFIAAPIDQDLFRQRPQLVLRLPKPTSLET